MLAPSAHNNAYYAIMAQQNTVNFLMSAQCRRVSSPTMPIIVISRHGFVTWRQHQRAVKPHQAGSFPLMTEEAALRWRFPLEAFSIDDAQISAEGIL